MRRFLRFIKSLYNGSKSNDVVELKDLLSEETQEELARLVFIEPTRKKVEIAVEKYAQSLDQEKKKSWWSTK